jgi:hypothetical protein
MSMSSSTSDMDVVSALHEKSFMSHSLISADL